MFSNELGDGRREDELSVYERVLGERFADLDPRLRTYFGVIPAGAEGFGVGSYRDAGLRVRALSPLFALLGHRRVAFAEYGEDVPFTVRNIPADEGSLRAERTFRFANATRVMADTLRVVDGRLLDRIGIRGEFEVELALQVSGGGLRMESRALALRVFGLRLPLPGIVRVALREDAREDGTQAVDVRITAPLFGEIYGYSGTFTYALRPLSGVGAAGQTGGTDARRRPWPMTKA